MNRIEIVNELIKHISSIERRFFYHKDKETKEERVAYIFLKNKRLYMFNQYNGVNMFLHTKYGYPPKRFHNGGTLWELTKEFKGFILNGEKMERSGLYSPYWGYSEESMVNIRNKAKQLGFL